MESGYKKTKSPASLYLTLDSDQRAARVAVSIPSDKNFRDYISDEVRRVQRHDSVFDCTLVEYRFPNRKIIPPFGGRNGGNYMDALLPVLGWHGIAARNSVSLHMAAFLAENKRNILQPPEIYSEIVRCPRYREFLYLNSIGCRHRRDRLTADDIVKLASIKAKGGPDLDSILSRRNNRPVKTEPGNNSLSVKTGRTL